MLRMMSRGNRAPQNYVRTYRKRAALTQRDIAYLVTGSRMVSTVHRWERGTQAPSLAAVLALEILLDARACELFDDLYTDARRIIKQRGAHLLSSGMPKSRQEALRAAWERCRSAAH